MKKIIALVFMVCMVLAISIPAFAEGDGQTAASTQQSASDTQQPAATQPAATQPTPTQPAATQPAPTQPAADTQQPTATQPAATQPATTQPAPQVKVPVGDQQKQSAATQQQKQAVAAQQKQIADLQKQLTELQKQKQDTAAQQQKQAAAAAQQQKKAAASQQQKQAAAAEQQKLAAKLQQQNALIQKLMAMIQKLMGGNTNDNKITTDIENELNADANADLSALTDAAKDDAATKEDMNAFKGKLDYLFTELNDLRATCNANWQAIKNLNNVIKTEWTRIKGDLKALNDQNKSNQILTDLKSKLEPARTIVNNEQAKVKALREAKTAQWANFRAAAKARDLAGATEAMKNIINLKSQIISEQPKIMAAKQEIIRILKDVAL